MPTIAMVMYNRFLNDQSNGVKTMGENRILLLQNTRGGDDGEPWLVDLETDLVSTLPIMNGADLEKTPGGLQRRVEITNLWSGLVANLPILNFVVVYVGLSGAEAVVNLAATHRLPPSKLVVVMCSCDADTKRALLQRFGFENSRVIDCECGGLQTMRQIYRHFLANGHLNVEIPE